MTTVPRKLAAAALALAAPALVLGTYLPMRDRLPDPLPVHWNLSGAVDGTASLPVFFGVVLGIATLLALGVIAVIALLRPDVAARTVASLVMFGVWITAGTWLVTALLADGAARAQEVALPWYAVLALVLVPALIGIGTYAVLPGQWQTDWARASGGQAGSSSLVLSPDESVMWLDQSRSRVMQMIAVVLVAAALGALILLPADAMAGSGIAAVVFFATAALIAWMSQITVRIDERGVHTLWGPLYWPRGLIPLAQIAAVRAEEINPLQWGGWGYRISKLGTAIVIRRGPGLVISRGGHRPDHAITLPHAAEGADVLRALLARQHAAS